MKYQLVMQWPADSIDDYDAMMQIEEMLIRRLPDAYRIDGHDAGAGEASIFIHTDDPLGALAELQSILTSRDFWVGARIAYRELLGDKYVVLWPATLRDFTVR